MPYYVTYLYRTGLTPAELGIPHSVAISPFLFHYYFGYRSSELLVARIALWLNGLFGSGKVFDIRWLGTLNALILLAGLASVIAACRQFHGSARVVTVILAGVAFSDVGYVLYCNSFYSEAVELGCMLLGIGLLANVAMARRPLLVFIGFSMAAAMAVTAKNETDIFAIPLALLGGVVAWRHFPTGYQRNAAIVLCVAVLGAGLWEYSGELAYFTSIYEYDCVFNVLLREVQNKGAVLTWLGFSPRLARFAGTSAFSPHSYFAGRGVYQAFFSKFSLKKVFEYYVLHPSVLVSLLAFGAAQSFQLRIPYLGNYANHSYAASGQFAPNSPWTVVHRYLLPGSLWFIVLLLLAVLVVGVALFVKSRPRTVRFTNIGSSPEVLIALPIMAGLAYVSAMVIEGSNELIKHQVLFNLLSDLCLIALVGLVIEYVSVRRQRRRERLELELRMAQEGRYSANA